MQSSFQHMPGHLIRRLHQISTSVFVEHMDKHEHDFTPIQFAALSCICANPGIDQAGLAGVIACDRVTTGGVVDRLEQKGFVTRTVNNKDRRARLVRATSEGVRNLDAVAPVIMGLQTAILSGLDENERIVFVELLEKATRNGNQLSRAPQVSSNIVQVENR